MWWWYHSQAGRQFVEAVSGLARASGPRGGPRTATPAGCILTRARWGRRRFAGGACRCVLDPWSVSSQGPRGGGGWECRSRWLPANSRSASGRRAPRSGETASSPARHVRTVPGPGRSRWRRRLQVDHRHRPSRSPPAGPPGRWPAPGPFLVRLSFCLLVAELAGCHIAAPTSMILAYHPRGFILLPGHHRPLSSHHTDRAGTIAVQPRPPCRLPCGRGHSCPIHAAFISRPPAPLPADRRHTVRSSCMTCTLACVVPAAPDCGTSPYRSASFQQLTIRRPVARRNLCLCLSFHHRPARCAA